MFGGNSNGPELKTLNDGTEITRAFKNELCRVNVRGLIEPVSCKRETFSREKKNENEKKKERKRETKK